MRWTRFCYLHYYNKPFATLVAHARRKLEGLVDHHDSQALQVPASPACPRSASTRCCSGPDWPMTFDAVADLAAHPDVQAAGTAPLQHHLWHGWGEGRRLG